MGNLIRTPYSEVTSTLEVLDTHRVTSEHFARLRADEDYAKRVAAAFLAEELQRAEVVLDPHRPHAAEPAVAATMAAQPKIVEVFNLADMEGWARYYHEQHLGVVMPDNLDVPVDTGGYEWVAVEKVDQAYGDIIRRSRTWYEMYLYNEDLDEAVPADKELQPASWIQQGVWRVVRCRSGIEADEELKNRSADWLSQQAVATMNLRQRLVLGDRHFLGTRKHLDRNNYTLCAGSRYRLGGVPGVGFNGARVSVDWWRTVGRGARIRARAVLGKNART